MMVSCGQGKTIAAGEGPRMKRGLTKIPKPPPSSGTKSEECRDDVDGDVKMNHTPVLIVYGPWGNAELRTELEKLNAALPHLSNTPKATAEVNQKIMEIQDILFANKRPAQRLDIAELKLKQTAADVAKTKTPSR